MTGYDDQPNHSAHAGSSELQGRNAVVTGGAGGIGQAICLALAAAGANVLVHTRARRDAAERVAEQVRRIGPQAGVELCDLQQDDQVMPFARRAWSWQPQGIDIWVNNAGADVLTGPNAKLTFEQKLEMLWHVDVLGTVRLSRTVGHLMRDSGVPGRCILNVSWDQADHGMEGESGEMFAAAKGAIAAFSRSLAKSLAPAVRVNCLAPGWIRTAWGEEASEYWRQRACRESLRERWGTPEDVAAAARFLAGPGADFLNGLVLPVNGGFRHGQP